jgi:vanillate/3-O-methylgallate O-demethylase
MSTEIINALRNSPGCYHPGWGGPEYTNWRDEQMSWKQTCYIGDWSFLGSTLNLLFEGPEALKLLSNLSVNSFAKFDIGQAKHIIQSNDDGKVITEGILMRLGEGKFVAQSSPSIYISFKLDAGQYNVNSWQEAWFNFQVQGPNSLYVLENVAGESMRDIRFMRFRTIHIKGREVFALRQGMAGELGYELQGPQEYAQEIYDAILEAGQEYGIRRLGRRTVMINHLEACFPTGMWHYLNAMFGSDMEGFFEYTAKKFPGARWLVPKITGSFQGNDISDYCRSPVELGWAKNIKFDHDFTGRKTLGAEVANPKRTIVTLEFNSDDMIDIYASMFREGEPYDFMDIPHQEKWVVWADQVLKDRKLVGVSSVPGYSYYFRKVLSLTYIDVKYSKPGTEVVVIWGNPGTPQKQIRATVAPAPYKKDNRRIDVTKLPSYLK